MTTVSAAVAKSKLSHLLQSAAKSHRSIRIKDRKNRVVLVSEEDWQAIQETLYLLTAPGMRASIRRGIRTPVSKCAKRVHW